MEFLMELVLDLFVVAVDYSVEEATPKSKIGIYLMRGAFAVIICIFIAAFGLFMGMALFYSDETLAFRIFCGLISFIFVFGIVAMVKKLKRFNKKIKEITELSHTDLHFENDNDAGVDDEVWEAKNEKIFFNDEEREYMLLNGKKVYKN